MVVLLNFRFFFSDLTTQQDIFTNAISHFAAEQEEVRAAAAFAAGMSAVVLAFSY